MTTIPIARLDDVSGGTNQQPPSTPTAEAVAALKRARARIMLLGGDPTISGPHFGDAHQLDIIDQINGAIAACQRPAQPPSALAAETVAQFRALLEKATPGPWNYQEESDRYTHIVRARDRKFVCQFPQDLSGRAEADARLIVLLRTNAEVMLAVLQRPAQSISNPFAWSRGPEEQSALSQVEAWDAARNRHYGPVESRAAEINDRKALIERLKNASFPDQNGCRLFTADLTREAAEALTASSERIRVLEDTLRDEREACALIADRTGPRDGHHLAMALRIAEAIRARADLHAEPDRSGG